MWTRTVPVLNCHHRSFVIAWPITSHAAFTQDWVHYIGQEGCVCDCFSTLPSLQLVNIGDNSNVLFDYPVHIYNQVWSYWQCRSLYLFWKYHILALGQAERDLYFIKFHSLFCQSVTVSSLLQWLSVCPLNNFQVLHSLFGGGGGGGGSVELVWAVT